MSMTSITKNIAAIDAVCDCIPIVSTITNGLQLLYKLAYKIDAAANPLKIMGAHPIEIHMVTKSNLDCFWGMIPIVGNIVNIVMLVLYGLPHPSQV